ncbi:intraflagellar transport protein 25 [Biomphalaria glabrata]|uniref:Intraflagellar transport protein 25 homolog n=1 Tax=Biomphalaria glabrata TaxID=6526 RepID=A0A9U8E8Q2_BIOGL|nr:intraflagellar transport protein 25 homolog [Biomphalaria glabrata]KAI8749677.1 putative intraflagellar transport protein 25 [Biomphalaria glabrata]
MFDVALASADAHIALATSSDEKHPPEHMIDGNAETFWSTTGMFPQEVVIRFQSLMKINNVHICSYNVKRIRLESSEGTDINKFDMLAEKIFEEIDSQLQQEEIQIEEKRAQSIRLVIESGYDHFISIHKVVVSGQAVH